MTTTQILYVEDNPFDADLTRRELRRTASELELDVVDTLAEAGKRLSVTPLPYKVVLLDLRLPDGDGLNLLNQIRQKELPLVVIILTGGGDEETAVSALKAGADDYITKRANYLSELPYTIVNAIHRFEAGEQARSRRMNVLYAERNLTDVELTRAHLAHYASYIQMDVVATERDVLGRIRGQSQDSPHYDVLLLDYGLGPMNALDLVKQISREGKPILPVVMVTAQGNEEAALQAIKLGAADYVVKSPGYLFRLPGALENAFHLAELEREKRALEESERRFRLLAENSQDTIFRFMVKEGRFEYFSPSLFQLSGYLPEEMYADPDLWRKTVVQDDISQFERLLAGEMPESGAVIRLIHRDGGVVWTDQRYSYLRSPSGELVEIHGSIRDITARHLVEIERDRLALEKQEALVRLEESYEKTIEGWALALELRDYDTQGHSMRSAALAVKMAQAMGFDAEGQKQVRRGALLHDIGKLGVSDNILLKSGPLTPDEWDSMKKHPTYSYKLLYPIEFLRPAIDIPYCHHERWDGTGYPNGLKGEEIPLAARIFAVVDVWEALNSDRPYRPAWDSEQVIQFLKGQAGIKFDAKVVDILLRVVQDGR